ncbi:MAG TPA: hypothetical protein VNN07_12145 [Candidatus Tectomicrobia bacterium]|nr:hypothetical protein [Candidatus Tectomicrobia bacterium]
MLSTTEVSRDLAARVVAWNGPVHLAHAAVLGCGLIALLAVPLRERTRD